MMEAELYEIGRRIQHLRRLHKMTQESLAEYLDVSVKHISSVERGVSSLSLDKLIRVSELLDCSMDYLILGKKSPEKESYIPQSIMEIFSRSDAEERQLLQEYLLLFKKIHR